MKYTFSELQTYFASKLGFDAFSKLDTHTRTHFKIKLNELLNWVWYHKQWSFSGDRTQFTTVPPYETGTVSGTAGEFTVTGSGTSWPAHVSGVPIKGQLILIGAKLYKIRARISTTKIILEAPLADTISGLTYKIYFAFYPTRPDIGAIRQQWYDNSDPLGWKPEGILEQEVNEGTPEVLYNAGQLKEEFLSGTGTFTNGSKTVSSVSGFTIEDALIGKPITLLTSNNTYYIVDVDSGGSTLTLDRTFKETTATGATCLIDAKGTPLIGIKPYPTLRHLIQIAYTFQPTKLIGDNDISELPNDAPLLAGIEVMGTKWETVGERGFINEVIYQDKKFKDSMKVLNFRGTPLKKRFYTPGEQFESGKRGTNIWNS